MEAYELAPDGADYVVDTKYRLAALRATGWNGCNLRTPFTRILKRAGLEPWPKLFHTMRSSRETELVNKFSIHKVAAWLGNTPKIALKHYLQVTDEDFQQAAEFERPGVTVPISKSGTVCGTQAAQNAAQNAAQQPAATASTEQQETKQAAARERLMPRDATGCLLLQPAEVELDGLEQGDQTSGTSNVCIEGSAKSSALCAETHSLDPQLQLLIERWPTLSKDVQQQIMLLVG